MPVAVVTGSSSGIGACTALTLAEHGYSVILHARRNLLGMQSTARAIESLASYSVDRPRVRCMTGDIGDASVRRDIVEAAFAWHGSVDVWVNNAGADVLTGEARKATFEQRFDQLWRVDVAGTIHLSRMVAAKMLLRDAQRASKDLPTIINLGWDQAQLGMEGEAGQLFCPAKSAVMSFTKALALSVGHRIRVNCVAPGWIRTSWGSDSASEYWDKRARDEATLERWGEPADVAQTILWLVGPLSQFINGQVIQVNGGRRFYPNPS